MEKINVLWLDDNRDPQKAVNCQYIKKQLGGENFNVYWAKTAEDMKSVILSGAAFPDMICFDHDLANEHYTPKVYWGDYAASLQYQENRITSTPTGYDAAVWLVQYCRVNRVVLPKFCSQSTNPVGRDKIMSMLTWEAKNRFYLK